MIIGVGPNELDWAGSIIPHELSHLVVDALVFNCHGVQLPTWLSEGLAETSEGPLTDEQRDLVISALEEDRLPSLNSLAGSFSAFGNSAHLSYLQSAAVLQYMIEEYGSEQLARLLAVMQAGEHIDPALEQVYGFDTQGLDAAWRASLGFSAESDSPVNEIVPPTSTQVPTLAPIVPLFQATPSITPTATKESVTPTTEPTPRPISPTTTPTSLASPQPPATPEAQSGSSPSIVLIVSVVLGSLFAFLVLLYRLIVRRK
jgi:hypothetical protein